MVHVKELRAKKRFGPGYFIREQMEMREWTQDDLSSVTGFTVKHLNKVLQDKQPLSLEMARVLGEVFNTTAQYWINIDTGYRLWLEQEKTKAEIEADIKGLIYERMPIKDMLAKGWLQPFTNASELKEQVLRFWNWDTLDFSILDRQLVPCLSRKSESFNQFNASYAYTWYQMARKVAHEITVHTYNRDHLQSIFNRIHVFSSEERGVEQFLTELNNSGVKFFILPHLQKTYLDGAAFYSNENPVIVYTARYRRLDNFWFTVTHEIAHILLHLNNETMFILDNLKDGERDEMEDEANELAAEKLRHPEIFNYLTPYLNYLSASKVEECAAQYQVHPSIVIGKLAYGKHISYKNLSLFNENVLDKIPDKYKIK